MVCLVNPKVQANSGAYGLSLLTQSAQESSTNTLPSLLRQYVQVVDLRSPGPVVRTERECKASGFLGGERQEPEVVGRDWRQASLPKLEPVGNKIPIEKVVFEDPAVRAPPAVCLYGRNDSGVFRGDGTQDWLQCDA